MGRNGALQMKAWLEANYKMVMLAAMGIELLLLLWIAYRA